MDASTQPNDLTETTSKFTTASFTESAILGPTLEDDANVETLEEGIAPAHVQHDMSKQLTTFTTFDSFLTNFTATREENDRLKQTNATLEMEVERMHRELLEVRLGRDALQTQMMRDRDQSKELLWKLRADFQKVQEERSVVFLLSKSCFSSFRNHYSQ